MAFKIGDISIGLHMFLCCKEREREEACAGLDEIFISEIVHRSIIALRALMQKGPCSQ
jgi:hypothetical protein